MRTVEVSVTAEHITQGEQQNCIRCPVALALLEVVPVNVPFEVNETHVLYVLPDGRYPAVGLPGEAQDFIQVFDTEGAGLPFTFGFVVPDESEAAS